MQKNKILSISNLLNRSIFQLPSNYPSTTTPMDRKKQNVLLYMRYCEKKDAVSESQRKLPPGSAAYYSKIDMIRPESALNFKKIRPGSAVTFNTKVHRPISSLIRPESAFIKEDKEEDEDHVSSTQKEASYLGGQEGFVTQQEEKDELEEEINRQLNQEFRRKDEFKEKQREKIKMDFQASSLQPSQQIEQLLEDYKSKARTKIPDVEPPAERQSFKKGEQIFKTIRFGFWN